MTGLPEILSFMMCLTILGLILLLCCLFLKDYVENKLSHKHKYTNKLTVSGYGHTEYEIWFCESCDKVFGEQTKNYN